MANRLPRTRNEAYLGVALSPEMVKRKYGETRSDEQVYYAIHGRWPKESTRVNPVLPKDQFWSEYTDSVAQERNRSARLSMDKEINEAVSKDIDAAFLQDLRDEMLLQSTTAIMLGSPNKSGKKKRVASQIIQSFPDEAIAIDIQNAEAFLKHANTTDPRTLDDAARAELMKEENSRFSPDYSNPIVKEVLAAAERQLDGGSITGLGNAATDNPGSKGYRARTRNKNKKELKEDARNLIAQKVMGRSPRTGAQTDGRGTDIEHIIAANLMSQYNNEGVNKYPGPKYLNRAYGDETGAEQVRRTKQHLDELYILQMAQDNPNLLRDSINYAPEIYPEYGVKPKTISNKIGIEYADKFARFPTADKYMPFRKAGQNPVIKEMFN